MTCPLAINPCCCTSEWLQNSGHTCGRGRPGRNNVGDDVFLFPVVCCVIEFFFSPWTQLEEIYAPTNLHGHRLNTRLSNIEDLTILVREVDGRIDRLDKTR